MGGTFGCFDNPLRPIPPEQFLAQLKQLNIFEQFAFDTIASPYIMDSSALAAPHWLALIQQILDLKKQGYEKFILIHGTDTMSYACAVLSRFLQQQVKLIVTGSQLPLFSTDGHKLRDVTDAATNLGHALTALDSITHGIYLSFAGKLLHGATVLKQHTHDWDAFTGVDHLSPRPHCNTHVVTNIPNEWYARAEHFHYLAIELTPQPIEQIKKLLELLLQDPPDTLVLKGFGSGNFSGDEALIRLLKQFAPHTLCLLTSQVNFGQLSQDYAVSSWIKNSPLIYAREASAADLYAKALQLYLQYPTVAERYEHWHA